MKEIYVNSFDSIKYTIFAEGEPIDATGLVGIYINDVFQGNATKTTGKVGEYTFLLPLTYVSQEQKFDVKWSFSVQGRDITVQEYYVVVTPYIQWSDFYNDFSSAGKTYQDYLEAEKVARQVIDSYCGQSFGRITTTYEVDGSGDSSLTLPYRLINLLDVSWYEDPNVIHVDQDIPWELAADGWVLRKRFDYSDPDPVRSNKERFKRDHIYYIRGNWGWDGVPAGVGEAAKILAGSYVCPDITYRNRYLESIKSGDWRIQFSSEAWKGTGDAVVDEILDNYRTYMTFGVI